MAVVRDLICNSAPWPVFCHRGDDRSHAIRHWLERRQATVRVKD